jgi:membrane-anchored protein YejM (alkaline phosphatase superfamily)
VWACLRTAYPAPKLITWKVMAAQVPMLRLGQQIMEGWSWRRLRAHTHQEG